MHRIPWRRQANERHRGESVKNLKKYIACSVLWGTWEGGIPTKALAQWNWTVVVIASGVTFICFIFSITIRLSSADFFSIN